MPVLVFGGCWLKEIGEISLFENFFADEFLKPLISKKKRQLKRLPFLF